jgi:hypothetical protein
MKGNNCLISPVLWVSIIGVLVHPTPRYVKCKDGIQVCYYKDCGVIYGEKEPLSDSREIHGLCPKHLQISLNEIKSEMEKLKTDG